MDNEDEIRKWKYIIVWVGRPSYADFSTTIMAFTHRPSWWIWTQTPSSSPRPHCKTPTNQPKYNRPPSTSCYQTSSTSCYQTGQCVSQPAFKIFCQCHRRCNTRHSLSRPILALRAIPVRPRLPSYPTRHPSCNAAVWKKLSAGLWPTTMPQSLAYQHQLLAEKLTRVTLPFGAHPSRQM